ncbi:MAG: transposase, partial [Flavobacteriaceae bacterium]
IESLRYCARYKGLNIYAYCLMTNHLHLVANCNEPFQLRDTIRDFKRYSAKRIIGQIRNEPESRRENFMFLFKNAAMKNSKGKGFKFWKTGNHAIDLYSEKFI